MRMNLRFMICLVLVLGLASCANPQKKTAAAKQKQKEKIQALEEDMIDDGGDPNFLAFVGRLRQAVAQHDLNTLASMMTTNFGYSLNPPREGDGVYQYWDQANVWPQLQTVLNQHFATNGNYLVAPVEFVTNPNFHGWRAGITSIDGVWKFAYFVTDN
jgi:hypothetical protein